MTPEQQAVLNFMRAFEQPIEVIPKMPAPDVQDLAYALIHEELEEFREAINDNNIIECADALGDLLYVVYWAANAFGFDLKPVFDEIHASNMTKVGGTKAPNGKLIKPSTYRPPDIAKVLKPW